jgi:hypothetical protein
MMMSNVWRNVQEKVLGAAGANRGSNAIGVIICRREASARDFEVA